MVAGLVRNDSLVTAVQTSDEIQAILQRLHGREIASLQVLGINSLKSLSPMPDAAAGEVVSECESVDRVVTVRTSNLSITFDLQRTGRLVWHQSAEPYRLTAGASRPTVRLLLTDGTGLDLIEPAKTKRITVTIESTSQ